MMGPKAIESTLRAIRNNWSFGVPLDFEGRCVQAWPVDGEKYEVSAGCYVEFDGLPEYEHLKTAGAEITTSRMGQHDEFVTFKATLDKTQMAKYLSYADGADVEP